MKKLLIFALFTGLLYLLVSSFVDLKPSINSDFEIKGIDISHHNRIDDWEKINDHSRFCIIKATEGTSFKDPRFNLYWSESKQNKITRAAYHFFSPGVSAEKQFQNFKSRVTLETGDLPPVLDVERKECDMNEVNKWLELAEAHYKVKPIVYSDYFFFKALMEGKVDSKYPLWLFVDKRYKVRPSFDNYDCLFWQYSQTGKVEGVSGHVDLDMFMGDSVDFENLKLR